MISKKSQRNTTNHTTRIGAQGIEMAKYTIHWDAGYGKTVEVIEAESMDDAEKQAHEQWKEEAEMNGDYGAKEYEESDEDLL